MPQDVVLAPGPRAGRWRLNPDPDHPILFDHGGDHVPGMVLLEAARQAACALLVPGTTLIPTRVSTAFHRYAEFGAPCWVEAAPMPAQPSGALGVLVTGHQSGHQVFATQISGPLTPQR
ncbi:AfsA-related hotdog domain-containing protein [Streptomyces albus]|uniref:AfsA-related hotdog domain-containing protein n=1 Tax=Streptomyces albus TaxID=1888 RepID=UPI0024ADE13C|nr:AfsA-related hotdog domain-containing protein [Streptomyces albus]MDI6413506.1 AfsA-related hotdog domain-containing protein [Streptomyces albus]